MVEHFFKVMCGIYGITEKNENLITGIIKKCSHRGLMVLIFFLMISLL